GEGDVERDRGRGERRHGGRGGEPLLPRPRGEGGTGGLVHPHDVPLEGRGELQDDRRGRRAQRRRRLVLPVAEGRGRRDQGPAGVLEGRRGHRL
ncbi:MAG: protein of unknown function DUF427, partial [uncultured Acidimicrobiales bacterium]